MSLGSFFFFFGTQFNTFINFYLIVLKLQPIKKDFHKFSDYGNFFFDRLDVEIVESCGT